MLCRHCKARPAITGDFGEVCWVCLYRWGDAARRPELLAPTTRGALLRAHGDVVSYVQETSGVSWVWTRTWPTGSAA